jgi:phage FluMu gp28-like protein
VVVTVARVEYPSQTTVMMPYLRIVEHYWWTGRRHPEVYADLVHLLGTVWACRRIVVDASGVGAGVASFLQATLGPSVVEQFIFTSRSKSDLAFAFLAAVNTGRVTMYRSDAYDETAAEFWRQVENARTQASPRGTLNFFVPESLGHDDFLISAALCVWAARGLMVTPSAAAVPHPLPYHDGQY